MVASIGKSVLSTLLDQDRERRGSRANLDGKLEDHTAAKRKWNGLVSAGKGIDTGIRSYDPTTDCCCLF